MLCHANPFFLMRRLMARMVNFLPRFALRDACREAQPVPNLSVPIRLSWVLTRASLFLTLPPLLHAFFTNPSSPTPSAVLANRVLPWPSSLASRSHKGTESTRSRKHGRFELWL